MTNKQIFFLISACVLAVGVFFVLSQLSDNSPGSTNTTQNYPIVFPSGTNPITTSTSSYTSTATSSKTYDGAVTEEQFVALKKRWTIADSDGLLVGTSTNDYALSYSREYDMFNISIISDPPEEWQRIVEQELLHALDITEQEACTLQVVVGWKTWSTNNEFIQKPLSFCSGMSNLAQ